MGMIIHKARMGTSVQIILTNSEIEKIQNKYWKNTNAKRCSSIHKTFECDLAYAHTGNHVYIDGGVPVFMWDDQDILWIKVVKNDGTARTLKVEPDDYEDLVNTHYKFDKTQPLGQLAFEFVEKDKCDDSVWVWKCSRSKGHIGCHVAHITYKKHVSVLGVHYV